MTHTDVNYMGFLAVANAAAKKSDKRPTYERVFIEKYENGQTGLFATNGHVFISYGVRHEERPVAVYAAETNALDEIKKKFARKDIHPGFWFSVDAVTASAYPDWRAVIANQSKRVEGPRVKVGMQARYLAAICNAAKILNKEGLIMSQNDPESAQIFELLNVPEFKANIMPFRL